MSNTDLNSSTASQKVQNVDGKSSTNNVPFPLQRVEKPLANFAPEAAFSVQTLKGPTFKIILSDGEGVVYYVHAEKLEALSMELKKHMKNDMKEGLQGEMVLQEVDEGLFQRFLEWVYVGDYTVDPC
ncbi:hypothetical protein BDZ91DRAFT_852428 [Kalaharituber pfeilii]|nr:hypothetical protein BDZ91DRAFT_852428 [Kalaharituber pfeilii]